MCASLVFASVIVKSTQFPCRVWLHDAIGGHIPILALIHTTTIVEAKNFL